MLRVVEQSYRSDTGRQRTANEDSLFARAPLFAVADGMGGAQAGEVASKIAADAFEPAQTDDRLSPETFLREIAMGANREIHRLAQDDSSRSGMGTTLTAALLRDEEISFAHVGDSRAYLFRDGELRLLTSDHSLVEELRRQGRLTEEQAEDHPQRSIITRALGPEPEVEVDTMTYRARTGDVYLLCSDGLTTMVKEDRIAEVLADSPSLDEVTSKLVGDANEAGGRDNITIVAFRLGGEPEAAEPDPGATLVGPAAAEVRDGVAQGGPPPGGVERRKSGIRPRESEPARARRRSDERPRTASRVAKALLALAVLAAIVVAAFFGIRQVHFLGTDEGGRVTLFRGLPYDLPLGIELYEEVESYPVQASSVPPDRRDSLINHELRSRDDAVSLAEDLRTAAEEARPPAGAGGGGTGSSGARGGDRRDGGDREPGGGGGGGDAGGSGSGSAGSRR